MPLKMDAASSHLPNGPNSGKPAGTGSNDARWKATSSVRSVTAVSLGSVTQGSAGTASPRVYGPEPPPSMARSKVAACVPEPTSLDLKNLTLFLDGGRRGEVSRSDCMKQTEAELQRLFHSRLVELMDSNGYHDGDFTETDVANVMVANGFMSAPSDDPLVALATELKSEMCSIFHSNMRRMSNSVIDPELLAGIASDPIVIDSIIDLSRGHVRSGDSSDATAPFEDIAKVLRSFSLTEYFNNSAANEDNDTDSNDEYEDEVTPCNAPDVPLTAKVGVTLADDVGVGIDDTTANYPRRARRRARNRGKTKSQDAAFLAPAYVPAPDPPSVLAPAPVSEARAEAEPVDPAAPKITRGQRRRMRRAVRKDATIANGDSVSEDVVASDPCAPAFGAYSSVTLLNAAASSTETSADKLVQVGHVYGRTPEGQLTRFPMMGPPPLPGACPPSPESKHSRIVSVGPAKPMPARVSTTSVEGSPVADVKPARPPTSVPAASASVAETPAVAALTAPTSIAGAPVTTAPLVDAPGISGPKRAAQPTKTLWSSDAIEEKRRVREFWLSLGDAERQSLIVAEKKVVQARVREHQNFSCSCNVCSRKREAIESELDCLYDCYHEELKENARKEKMRSVVRAAEMKARSIVMSSVKAIADSLISKAAIDTNNCSKEVVLKNIIECLRGSNMTDNLPYIEGQGAVCELGTAVHTAALSASDSVMAKIASVVRYLDEESSYTKVIEDTGPSAKEGDKELTTVNKAAAAIKEWTDGIFAYQREFGREPTPCEDSDDEGSFNNNDLFYTENMLGTTDTFPTDSKKFFDMMEQLAEYRMRREDAFLDSLDEPEAGDDRIAALEDGSATRHAWSRKPKRQPRSQRRCPDCQGEIGAAEEPQTFSDSEYRVSRYAGTKRPRSESRGGEQSFGRNPAKAQFDDIGIEYVDHPDNLLLADKLKNSSGPSPPYDEEDDDDYEDEDDDGDDDEEDDDDLDLDDEDIDETDDDYDDLDPENAEKDAEEGRRVFQLFAARLFEQRVVNLYREKVARDRQQNLIKELEEEEKRLEAKEKRKQKKKLREKEKKRHIQQQKEEERLAKEEQERVEKEQRRAAQQKRVEEQLSKKREEEARARRAMEERNRRILEQADKRLAKEREERLRAEEERLEREACEREERSRRQRNLADQPAPHKVQEPVLAPIAVSAPLASPKPAPKPTADIVPATTSPAHTSTAAQSPVLPSTPVVASIAASLPARSPLALLAISSSTPLLDNALLPTVNKPSPIFMTSRPLLPMSRLPEHSAAPSSEALEFVPSRARANSGSSIRHPAPVPMPSFMASVRTPPSPSAMPSEFDAEIMSIVGRVMGSCTLQDDLIDGAEWRTEPVDSYVDSPRAMLPQPSHAAVFGLGDSLGPLSDMALRRNSVPVNRLSSEGGNGLAGFDFGSGKQAMSSALTGGMEGVYSAYCALEKFSRDKRPPLTAGLGQDMFGGSHSVAEIAQMHGMMRESSVWSLCVSYAQANPSKCRVNHTERTIALARSLSGVSPIAPTVADAQRLVSPASPHYTETPRSTPPVQLPIMPQFGQLPQQTQVGMSYSPVAHTSPSSLFFGPLATHGSQTPIHSSGSGSTPVRGPVPPFPLSSFQQPPLGVASLGHAHLNDGRGMTMIPPQQPPMPMSGSAQMFGSSVPAFGHQQQQQQMRSSSNSMWSPTKMGASSDAATIGDLTQVSMRQPLMTRFGSPHAFSQQQIQVQHPQQQHHHQIHNHQHPLH
ncbi:Stress response protein nst1 [Coemansia sp. BCRC 34301]|nr:Stress response protein nst1 [Coemansia sp. BCRC 34301]